jgi:hypothetical protein
MICALIALFASVLLGCTAWLFPKRFDFYISCTLATALVVQRGSPFDDGRFINIFCLSLPSFASVRRLRVLEE